MRRFFLVIGFLVFLSEINAQSIPEWIVTDLEKYIQTSETPVIISFWATYCIPCVKEVPYFQELVKKYEGWGVKLLLVSLDFKESYPDKIRKFSNKMKFTAPVVWLEEKPMPIISARKLTANGPE